MLPVEIPFASTILLSDEFVHHVWLTGLYDIEQPIFEIGAIGLNSTVHADGEHLQILKNLIIRIHLNINCTYVILNGLEPHGTLSWAYALPIKKS